MGRLTCLNLPIDYKSKTLVDFEMCASPYFLEVMAHGQYTFADMVKRHIECGFSLSIFAHVPTTKYVSNGYNVFDLVNPKLEERDGIIRCTAMCQYMKSVINKIQKDSDAFDLFGTFSNAIYNVFENKTRYNQLSIFGAHTKFIYIENFRKPYTLL